MIAAPSRRDRVLATVAAIALTIGGLVLEFIALLVAGFKCYESCSGPGGDWRDDPGAWQWEFQLWWATAALLLVAAAIPLAASGRLRPALATAGASAVAFAGWWAFVTG